MADVYMHSRLTEDIIIELSRDVDKNIAFLGSHASDPMYYPVMSKHAKQYRYYADRMHDTDTRSMLMGMVTYVKEHNTTSTYSFLVGFLSHYALDTLIHPYVYHHVGVYKKDKPETSRWRGLHLKFERSIDCVLIEQENGIKAHKLKLLKSFPIEVPNSEVLELMKDTFQKKFDIEDGDKVFRTSVVHMHNTLKYLAWDRFGIKKFFYKIHDYFNRTEDLFMQDVSFYNHIENYDFLNEEKRTWHHPVTNEAYNYSVKELYQQAKEFALDIIHKVDEYITGKEIDLNTVFTNLSFNSGVDCDQSKPFQYFNVYRP